MWVLRPSLLVSSMLVYISLTGANHGAGRYLFSPSHKLRLNTDCSQFQCLISRRNPRQRYHSLQEVKDFVSHEPYAEREFSRLFPEHFGNDFHSMSRPLLLRDPQILQNLQSFQVSKLNVDPFAAHSQDGMKELQIPKDSDELQQDGDHAVSDDVSNKVYGDILGVVDTPTDSTSFGKRSHPKDIFNPQAVISSFGAASETSSEAVSNFLGARRNACTCNEAAYLVDLGNTYYPRYHPSLNCTLGPCWLEPYSCKAKRHTVWVLKKRDVNDKINPKGPLLPEILRSSFVFEDLEITVACECGVS